MTHRGLSKKFANMLSCPSTPVCSAGRARKYPTSKDYKGGTMKPSSLRASTRTSRVTGKSGTMKNLNTGTMKILLQVQPDMSLSGSPYCSQWTQKSREHRIPSHKGLQHPLLTFGMEFNLSFLKLKNKSANECEITRSHIKNIPTRLKKKSMRSRQLDITEKGAPPTT